MHPAPFAVVALVGGRQLDAIVEGRGVGSANRGERTERTDDCGKEGEESTLQQTVKAHGPISVVLKRARAPDSEQPTIKACWRLSACSHSGPVPLRPGRRHGSTDENCRRGPHAKKPRSLRLPPGAPGSREDLDSTWPLSHVSDHILKPTCSRKDIAFPSEPSFCPGSKATLPLE